MIKPADIIGRCWREVGGVIALKIIMEPTVDVIIIIIAELLVMHVRSGGHARQLIIRTLQMEDNVMKKGTDYLLGSIIVIVAQQVQRQAE